MDPLLKYGIYSFILLNMLINFFYATPLYELGLNQIHSMQQHQSTILNYFFVFISLFADPTIVIVGIMVFIFLFKRKSQGFNLLLFFLFNCYLTTVLKAMYADPRPAWSHKKIHNIGYYCPREYGNPSGHSWFAPILAFPLFLRYLGNGKYNIYLIFAILMTVLIPISRMYLGAHSLNQIIQGLSLGFAFVFLYIYGGLNFQIQDFLANFTSKPKKWIIIVSLLHFAYILAFYLNTKFGFHASEISHVWAKNLKQKCNREVDPNYLNFMMLMLNSVLINLGTGIGLGYSQTAKDPEGQIYLSGEWHINKNLKNIPYFGYLSYFVVELFAFTCGSIVCLLFFMMGINQTSIFILVNTAAFLNGYFYVSKSFKMLNKLSIISGTTEITKEN